MGWIRPGTRVSRATLCCLLLGAVVLLTNEAKRVVDDSGRIVVVQRHLEGYSYNDDGGGGGNWGGGNDDTLGSDPARDGDDTTTSGGSSSSSLGGGRNDDGLYSSESSSSGNNNDDGGGGGGGGYNNDDGGGGYTDSSSSSSSYSYENDNYGSSSGGGYGGYGGYDSGGGSSSSSSKYHSPDSGAFWGKVGSVINVRVPLLPVLFLGGVFLYGGMLFTAYQFERNAEGLFTNCCRWSIRTARCTGRVLYNLYHCRLGEIPPIVCATDDDDEYTDEELERMQPRPGIARALENEHRKAYRRTNEDETHETYHNGVKSSRTKKLFAGLVF